MGESLSRRAFLGGLAAMGTMASVGALAGCSPQNNNLTVAAESSEAVDSAASSNAPSFFTKPDPIDSASITQIVDADIVVVGCGIGGCAAAAAAAEEGARVVALEKMPNIQYRGMSVSSVNCKLQLEQDLVTDIDQLVFEIRRWGGFLNDERVIRAWAYKSGESIDWLQGLYTSLGKTVEPKEYKESILPPYIYQAPVEGIPQPIPDTYPTPQGEVVGTLYEEALANGAEFYFSTPAEQLVQDESGRVTGVIASGEDGYIQFNSSKGVVLATGDYCCNEEMLTYYIPTSTEMAYCIFPGEGNTGDGHKMGLWVGAGMDRAPHCGMFFDCGLLESENKGNIPLTRQPWLYVNALGERFENEDLPFGYVCNSELTQPGGFKWSVWDSKWEEEAPTLGQTECKTMPVDPMHNKGPVHNPETLQKFMDNGVIHKADTLEELAEGMDVPVETFLATVERYNTFCENGKDEDFSKDPRLLKSLTEPPYYCAKLGLGLLVSLGGLNINEKLEVMSDQDEIIEGLYAIGNASGNFFAHDYPITVPGVSHGRALTQGYMVGKDLASA